MEVLISSTDNAVISFSSRLGTRTEYSLPTSVLNFNVPCKPSFHLHGMGHCPTDVTKFCLLLNCLLYR